MGGGGVPVTRNLSAQEGLRCGIGHGVSHKGSNGPLRLVSCCEHWFTGQHSSDPGKQQTEHAQKRSAGWGEPRGARGRGGRIKSRHRWGGAGRGANAPPGDSRQLGSRGLECPGTVHYSAPRGLPRLCAFSSAFCFLFSIVSPSFPFIRGPSDTAHGPLRRGYPQGPLSLGTLGKARLLSPGFLVAQVQPSLSVKMHDLLYSRLKPGEK